ncbi:unnamed protein product, partial [Cladocopium goreaui]
ICSRLSNFCLSHSWHGSLLSSWIAKGAAASLHFLRCSMPGAIFEKDLLQVASAEEESEKDTRQLSLGTTATGVDKSDEGEDINKVDDHSDGDGVAQASAQKGLLNADSEDDLEVPTSGYQAKEQKINVPLTTMFMSERRHDTTTLRSGHLSPPI